MSTIDHRYEAELAASAGKYDIAQYEATMYTAEQQRIANLIAYWHPEQPIHPASGADYIKSREDHRATIREGLGL